MTHRRDFLRALALGTGAILLGRGWYKPGQGLILPPEAWPVGLEGMVTSSSVHNLTTSTWPQFRVVGIDYAAPSMTVEWLSPFTGEYTQNAPFHVKH